MRSAFDVDSAPVFTTTIGDTPVSFEPRDGRWRAICGMRGLVEIWGSSYRDVRLQVDAIYAGNVALHIPKSAA